MCPEWLPDSVTAASRTLNLSITQVQSHGGLGAAFPYLFSPPQKKNSLASPPQKIVVGYLLIYLPAITYPTP